MLGMDLEALAIEFDGAEGSCSYFECVTVGACSSSEPNLVRPFRGDVRGEKPFVTVRRVAMFRSGDGVWKTRLCA